ncbi:phage tail protein [Ligilactobacillus salivarius]|nr:phage tail protein [Ligilactobacillus salivarius]
MYLLDKQQNIIKALDNTIVEASMIEEINAANKLTFSVMTNSRIDISIHYVCIPAPKGEEFLLFKLISETVKNDRVEYTAVESAYDELKSYAYIKDARPQDKTAGEMLTQILQGTRWSLGYIADTARASTNFYYITVLEAIQKVVDLFNVELTFTVNIDKKTNVISSRRINLYTQQGRRLGKRFEYGSNLLEVTREQSSEDLITALVGRGKGEEVSQGEDGSPDGYGRRITFADIEWKRANGNPADKPKGQEYVEDKDATALYGFSDGKPRIGLTTFEDITDPQELLKATWASLQVAKRPKVSFKASVLDVGDLGLGDTVAIIRHDLGIEYFTRVYKVDHDLLDKNNNTIELGDDFSQKSLTNYVSDVAKITENAKNTAEYAVSSANGKNKNYYSKSKPQYANEGDNLFLDLGNGETEYYVWHDGNWELVLSTADTTRVQKQVEEVQKDIADARVEADRLSQEQSKTAKELSDKITDISDKAIKNASDIKSVTDDIANVHADYVSQQANLNQQKQDLDQARQNVLSNSNRIDKLSVGLDSVNINVNNVNSKVDNIKVGGVNLMRNTTRDYVKFTGSSWAVGYPTSNQQTSNVEVEGGGTYTFSAWVKNDKSSTGRVDLEIYQYNANSENKQNGSSSDVSVWVSPGEEKKLVFTKTLLADTTRVSLHARNKDRDGTVTYWVKMAQVEKGTLATDWSPAPEDEIERVSQLRVDLDGLSGTVATNKGDIAQIKLTESGMQQSIKDAQGNISTLQNDSKQFKQQFQDVNGSIATITNTANSLSSQLSTKVGTSEYNSFKEQTAQELRTKLIASDLNGYAKSADVKVSVDGLNARFDNLNVGGTNLLKGTSRDLQQKSTTNDWVRLPYNTDFFRSIYPLDNFTTKVWIEKPNKDSWLQIYVGGNGVFKGNVIKAGQSGYSEVHGTLNNNTTSANLVIGAGDGVSVSLSWKELKLEKGTIATDWSPAPEDTENELQVLSGKITANSNEFSTVYTKITNAKNDAINAIKGDSQWQSMGKIVTNASFLQNSDGFAQEVVKTTIPMVSGGGTNLVRNSAHDPINLDHWTTNGVGSVWYATNLLFRNNTTKMFLLNNPNTDREMSIQTEYMDIEPDTDYTLSMVVFGASGVSSGDVYYNIKYADGSNTYFTVDGRFKYNPSRAERKVYKFHTSPNSSGSKATQVFIRIDNNGLIPGHSDGTSMLGDVKLEKGAVATPWSPAPEDLATKLQLNQVIDTADSHTRTISDYLTGSNSRFTQLSNNVNLKVNKGDVIGQINLEAGRTLLQNQKIYLDADTVAFSGKAFIPSAAIQSLDAGKITTGTLDAANVNIINLNANNITSGSIKGTNLDINLNSGNVSFQKGRIHDSNNYVDINIDEGYISTANNLGRLLFKENSLQIAGYNIFDNTDDYYLKIDNGMNGDSWAGANITGRDYVAISNKANSDGFMQISTIVQTNFAGIAAGKSTFGWNPTFVGGADRGVYIAGGKKFSSANSYRFDSMPSILIGVDKDGSKWYDNRVIINGNYVHIPEAYHKTTSAAPNVYVADDGALVRSTSAAKYKTDIVRSHDLDYGNKILNVPIATWIDKAEAERYAKKESEQEPVRHFGMIADDLASAGLEMLVTRNNDGELEGIQYDRIAPALIPVISNLKARLELLERKLLNE